MVDITEGLFSLCFKVSFFALTLADSLAKPVYSSTIPKKWALPSCLQLKVFWKAHGGFLHKYWDAFSAPDKSLLKNCLPSELMFLAEALTSSL